MEDAELWGNDGGGGGGAALDGEFDRAMAARERQRHEEAIAKVRPAGAGR